MIEEEARRLLLEFNREVARRPDATIDVSRGKRAASANNSGFSGSESTAWRTPVPSRSWRKRIFPLDRLL
jgi:hypothetical protein